MRTRAAVVREPNQLTIEEIELDPPRDHEVLVRMRYEGDNLSSDLGLTLASGLPVLERLAGYSELTAKERSAVLDALDQRRDGALYHLLLSGHTRRARALLAQVPRHRLAGPRRLAYRALAQLPGGIVRALARLRVGPTG